MPGFFADESLAVNSTTPVVLTPAKYEASGGGRATRAVIQCLVSMYYRFGAAPTSTVSYQAAAGDIIEINGFDNIRQVEFLTQSGSSTIFASYEI